MQITCGHCGAKHESIQAVRDCGVKNEFEPRPEGPVYFAPPLDDLPGEEEYGTPVLRPIPNQLKPEDKDRGLVENALYKREDAVWKISRSRTSGYLYAMRRNSSGGWDYSPGDTKRIKPEERMSLEDAAAYGKTTGQCIVCGRELTDPNSIAAGIGPICADRF